MYYPYLRGRQFELIALREYANERGNNNNIIPIIEPVKNSYNSMKLSLPKLIEGEVKFALVLNPQVGNVKNIEELISELSNELKDNSKWIPAFIITNRYSDILKEILRLNLSNVMLICSEVTDTSDNEFETLVFSDQIKYIVSKENRSLKRKLSKSNKKLIRLDDNFNAQKRNRDYLLMPEEKFTEEHMFYLDDGYNGFSDYTVLVSDFIEGGSAPYAVAIHITYTRKDTNEIWIKHFVSDTNDSIANIQGKFAEASKKAVDFIKTQKINNPALTELMNYYNDGNGTYPGLGMVKKISIKNHLELINAVINK